MGCPDAIGRLAQGRPLVDLVLTGHAHCLEYLRTGDTGHADSNINWIVCGGSGYSLRRQRSEGPELTETFGSIKSGDERVVARSQLFIGRKGHSLQKQRPYSFCGSMSRMAHHLSLQFDRLSLNDFNGSGSIAKLNRL
jgi:hypothetical protein